MSTSQVEKKLKKLSQLDSNGQVVLLETIEENKNELSDELKMIEESLSNKLDIAITSISSIEIPEQKDHTEHMQKMMDLINEPIEIDVRLNII